EHLLDRGKGEAETFAAQDELEPHAITAAEDADLAEPARRQQVLVFVEADRALRHLALGRKLADRVLLLADAGRLLALDRGQLSHGAGSTVFRLCRRGLPLLEEGLFQDFADG